MVTYLIFYCLAVRPWGTSSMSGSSILTLLLGGLDGRLKTASTLYLRSDKEALISFRRCIGKPVTAPSLKLYSVAIDHGLHSMW